ncbi:unnamed protein product [Symbiodinium sp. CCMP2592]|nr:unnamed protein product [Symbiodinium sp. CCMP2592]
MDPCMSSSWSWYEGRREGYASFSDRSWFAEKGKDATDTWCHSEKRKDVKPSWCGSEESKGKASTVSTSQENDGWQKWTWQDSSYFADGNNGWEDSTWQDSSWWSWNDPKEAPARLKSSAAAHRDTTASKEPEVVEISSDDSSENWGQWGQKWSGPSGASWPSRDSWSQWASKSRKAQVEAREAEPKRYKYDPTTSRGRSNHDDYDDVD